MNMLRKVVPSIFSLQKRHSSKLTFEREAHKIFEKVHEVRAMAETYEPSKLLVVERIATLYGRPYWEKKITELMGLTTTSNDRLNNVRKNIGTYVVVPNTPHVCKLLWRIKHLVRIRPVTFPDGLPSSGEFTGTHLSRFGVFTKDKNFVVDPERLQIEPKVQKTQLQGREIAKPMHLRWMNSI